MSAEHEPLPQTPNVLTASSPERGGIVTEQEPTNPENRDVQHGLREFIDNPIGKATVIAAGILAAAGATFGAIKATEAGPESSQAVATGPASPGASSTSTPEASVSATGSPEVLTVQSLEIPTGLTPEQLGTTITQRLSQWEMAGASPDWETAYVKTGGSFDFLQNIADQNGDIFAEALFVPGYESDADLKQYVSKQKQSNAGSLESWAKSTLAKTAADKEPFNRSVTADSTTVVSQGDGMIQLAINATEHDNASQNKVGQVTPSELAIDGVKETIEVTLQTFGGAEKISALTFKAQTD